MQVFDSRSRRRLVWSYGNWTGIVQSVLFPAAAMCVFAAFTIAGTPATAQGKPVKIVALGDSLTAGYGLSAGDAFPAKLARALKDKNIAVDIVNAGVSGDTTTGGLERLDWAVPPGTEAVIVELGANDMLRGVDPKVTRNALDTIVRKLRERKIAVLLCGMMASPNMGEEFVRSFNAIYPDVARDHGVMFYPFFLDGVAIDAKLNQRDGLHPTAGGVERIVEKILPTVEKLIEQIKAERGS